MPLSPETRLGPYEIRSLLGSGGMGEVYLAHDTRLGRDVAVKVLPEPVSSNPDRLRRFEQEARAAAALNHPGILAVHDVGWHEGSPYIVSELLEGETLRDTLRAGGFTVQKALEVALPLARALSAAHEKGIVHRDLKPENVFLTREQQVKVLDFGLAKLLPTSEPGAESAIDTRSTASGIVLGTASYMSPEQVRGRETDARSDVFSFGVLLYEMLAGRRPFLRDSAADVMSAILHEDPPKLMDLDVAVSPLLERITERCLKKRPEDRFQSAHDLAIALEAVSGAENAPALSGPTARKLRRLARAVAASAPFVALSAAGAAWLLGAFRPRSEPEFRPLTFRHGVIGHALFAPNSDTILYTASWEGQPARTFHTLPGAEGFDRSLDATEQFPLSYSGDGSQVLVLLGVFRPATSLHGTLAWWPALGGKAREILEDASWSDWSDRGSFFAVSRDTGTERVLEARDAAGVALRTLFRTDGGISCVRISPDGRDVAFIRHASPYGQRGEVWLVRFDGSGARALTPPFDQLLGLDWNRGKGELWFSGAPANTWGSTLWAVTLSGRVRSLYALTSMHVLTSVAPAGDRCLLRDVDDESSLIVRRREQPLLNLTWFGWSVVTDISPDGHRVLFYDGGASEKTHGTWMRPLEGGDAVRLGEGVPSRFSPDGRWIVMPTSPPQGPPQLALVPVGAGERRQLTSSASAAHGWPSFAGPDALLFTRSEGARSEVWRMATDGSGARSLGAEGCEAPEASSSGASFVCVGESGRALLVYPMEKGVGRKFHELPAGQQFRYARWSQHGDRIYAVTRGRRFLTLDTTSGQVLTEEALPLPGAGPYDNLIGAAFDANAQLQTYSVAQGRSGLFLMTNVH